MIKITKDALAKERGALKTIDKILTGIKKGVKPSRIRSGLFQPEQKAREPKMGTEKEAPQRREIVNVFRDAFQETPIRIGKYRAKRKGGVMMGFHVPSKSIIRLKEAGDIETAAHEFGHKLHYAMFGKKDAPLKAQRESITKELGPFMTELRPISRYAPHDLEGFAEFTRM